LKIDKDTIEDFEIGEKASTLWLGDLNPATTKKGKKYMMKIVPKANENLEAAIANEKACAQLALKIGSTAVRLQRLFHNDENQYFVYKHFEAENLAAKVAGGPLEVEDAKKLSRQFYLFLQKLHQNGIFYLRPTPLDNAFVTAQGKLLVVGMDSVFTEKGAEKPISPLVKIDGDKAAEETDLIVLGIFVHMLLTGANPVDPATQEVTIGEIADEDARALVEACLNKNGEERKAYEPLTSPFLQLPMTIQAEKEKITVNDMFLDWSEGIKIGFGENELGYNGEEGKFSIKSGNGTIEVSGEGLTLSCEEEEFNEEKGENETVTTSIEIGSDGLKLKNGDDETTIGGDGLKSQGENGEFEIGSDGFTYENADKSGKLVINDNLECTLADFKTPKFGNPTELSAAGIEVSVGSEGFSLTLGSVNLNISTAPDLTITAAGCALKISKDGLSIEAGTGIALSVNGEGLHFNVGDLVLEINGEGLRLEGGGFSFTIGKGGVQVQNGNAPIDFGGDGGVEIEFPTLESIKFKLPAVQSPAIPPLPPMPKPAVDVPSAPEVPTLPAISLFQTKENKNAPPGKIEDYLKEGETVVKQVSIVKTRYMGISKKQRILVLTSNNRVMYCTPNFSQMMGEIALSKDAKFNPEGNNKLSIIDATGKKFHIIFEEGEAPRNEWKDTLTEVCSKL